MPGKVKKSAAAHATYNYPVDQGNNCPRCSADLIFMDHISWKRHIDGHGGITVDYRCRRCSTTKQSLPALSSHYVHCKKNSGVEVARRASVSSSQDTDSSQPPEIIDTTTSQSQCHYCSRTFTTTKGRGVHEQRAHRVVYEASQQRGSRVHWSEEEKDILAAAEARLPVNTRDINQALQESLPTRSFDAMKSRRKTADHRARVQRFRLSSAEEISSSPNVTGVPENREDHLHLPLSPPSNESSSSRHESSPIREDSQNATEPSGAELFQEFFANHADDVDAQVSLICQGVLDGSFTLESVRNIFPDGEPRDNDARPPRRDFVVSKRKARQRRYKLLQRLFKTNKKRLAAEIFNNVDEVTDKPTIESIKELYGGLFSKASKHDDKPSKRRPLKAKLFYPISIEEVSMGLRRCSSSTPGPDGLSLRWLRGASVKMLVTIMNTFLYYKDIPSYLKKSRTVLLPKKGDLKDPNNWRPITISSLLIRLFHGILARRFASSIDFHPAQQAFLPVDGISANTLLLDYLISNSRKRRTELNLVSIDISKAFDSVSHHSIRRALRSAGVEEELVTYLYNTYLGCETSISCGALRTGSIKVTNGVKQGDPLSPLIFNCVMDEFARIVPPHIGAQVGETKCNVIFFADDLVLASQSKAGIQELLKLLGIFLHDRGLRVNTGKCKALVLTRLGKQKKIITDLDYHLLMDGAEIPKVTSDNLLTYLGVPYSPSGKCRPSFERINGDLRKLSDAPLKPHQKVAILRDFLLPRHMHTFTLSFFVKQDLTRVDGLVKNFCRKFLRLPNYSPIGFFYVKPRDGGLGLPCFGTSIPIQFAARLKNLESSASPVIQELYKSTFVSSTTRRVINMTQGTGKTKSEVTKYWCDRLYNTVYGAGLSQLKNSPISNSILMDFGRAESCMQFCSWVKTRLNLLPCRGAPSNQGMNLCRACHNKVESLSHISNGCPLSKTKYIARHDKFVALLRTSTKRRDVQISVEPRLTDSDGNLHKPDLVVVGEADVMVCDVACPWETPRSLAETYRHKVATYDTPAVRTVIERLWPGRTIRFCAFVVSARGVWCPENNEICDHLQLGGGFRRLTTRIALEQTYKIYKSFMDAVHFV